jgi:hypothetical protein
VPILPAEAEAEDTLPAGSSLAAVVAATVRLSSAEEEVVAAARATNRIAAVLVLDREYWEVVVGREH